MIGEFLDRRRRDHLIVAGGQHQDRLTDFERIARGTKAAHRGERRIGPGHGRRRDAERRVLLQDRGVAGIAHGIAGQGIADERVGADQAIATAGNVTAALPRQPHDPQQRRRRKRGAMPGKVDHRRGQHHAIEPALAGARDPQHHRAAHRMRQREIRWRAIRQHHLLHEGLDIDLEIRERADIALARIAQASRGVALAAPVDHRHRKTAVAQVAHGLEIFLDRFAAPGKHADGAFAIGRRRPAREPQFGAVRGFDGTADDVFRNRIGGNRDQRHAADRIGEKRLESRA